MKIQIAGPGCPRCEEAEKHVRLACAAAGIEAEIEVVRDPKEITRLGVMMPPGIVVDGRVIESGHVPSTERLTQAFTTLARMRRVCKTLRVKGWRPMPPEEAERPIRRP